MFSCNCETSTTVRMQRDPNIDIYEFSLFFVVIRFVIGSLICFRYRPNYPKGFPVLLSFCHNFFFAIIKEGGNFSTCRLFSIVITRRGIFSFVYSETGTLIHVKTSYEMVIAGSFRSETFHSYLRAYKRRPSVVDTKTFSLYTPWNKIQLILILC